MKPAATGSGWGRQAAFALALANLGSLPALSSCVDSTPAAATWRVDADIVVRLEVSPGSEELLAALEYEPGEPALGVLARINGDSVPDFLIRSSPRLCGNGGCPYVLVDGNSQMAVGHFFGTSLYLKPSTNGTYPPIATLSHLSADEAAYSEYRFDGNHYVQIKTRTLHGPALDSVLLLLRENSLPRW